VGQARLSLTLEELSRGARCAQGSFAAPKLLEQCDTHETLHNPAAFSVIQTQKMQPVPQPQPTFLWQSWVKKTHDDCLEPGRIFLRSCTAPHCWLTGEGDKATMAWQLEKLHRFTQRHWWLLNQNLGALQSSCGNNQQQQTAKSFCLYCPRRVPPARHKLLGCCEGPTWGIGHLGVFGSAKTDLQRCFFL